MSGISLSFYRKPGAMKSRITTKARRLRSSHRSNSSSLFLCLSPSFSLSHSIGNMIDLIAEYQQYQSEETGEESFEGQYEAEAEGTEYNEE